MPPRSADRMQHSFELVRRNDRLHLVRAGDAADRTLCGEPAAGEMIPFFGYDYPNKLEDPSEPRRATSMPSGAMVLFVGNAFCTIMRWIRNAEVELECSIRRYLDTVEP